MNINLAKDFFSKLLNSSIEERTLIRLTSAQSARAYAWLKENNFKVDDFPLSKGFTLQQLVIGDSLENSVKRNVIPQSNSLNYDDAFGNEFGELGVDIQSIGELFPEGLSFDPKSDDKLSGIFTTKELSYAQSKIDSQQTLTGIFAAKEAIQKCANEKINFIDIEILPDENGKPKNNLFFISISHSKDYAVAIAVKKYYVKPSNIVEEKNNRFKQITSTETCAHKKNVFSTLIIPTLVTLLFFIEVLRFFR